MKQLWIICLGSLSLMASSDLKTPYEKSAGLTSAAYAEGMAFYRALAATYPTVAIREMGLTDSGEPLHLVLFSSNQNFNIAALKRAGKRFLMINNAIHAGEPDGVDASMMFLRDLAAAEVPGSRIDRIVIGIIPFYNIGGVLNRNATSRVNQNGPLTYGFRGNARNFDLNRDFIKNDSLNARSFTKIFHLLDPDVYLETHVTNGSDHQYTLTLLTSQADKLGGPLSEYMSQVLEPDLMKRLSARKVLATPYVNVFGKTPDQGFAQFLDGPRYSTGYAALFQTLGFMTETHSLKPFKQRVLATRAFIECLVNGVIAQADAIGEVRARARVLLGEQKTFALSWEIDRSSWKTLRFLGYAAETHPSKVTPGDRLFYNRERPYAKEIPFYNKYKVQHSVSKPSAYLIPRGWHPIIALLERNSIVMVPLSSDRAIEVEVYHIESYKTSPRPYEGHYNHYDTRVRRSQEIQQFYQGDWLVSTDQPGVRYLMETLEPQAPDSFFNWNYFDTILQQKEYFSPYLFEDIAARLLKEHPNIKAAFEKRKSANKEFATNPMMQLGWIYTQSPHYEKAHNRYPIYRLNQPLD